MVNVYDSQIDKKKYHSLVMALKDLLNEGRSFNNGRLTEQADKHFGGSRGGGYYSPKDAYDCQEAAFNALLLTEAGRELWTGPTDDALSELRQRMQRLATQTNRSVEMVELQQFSTPPALAFVAARLLGIASGDVVLEPSAGTGNLAVWAKLAGAHVVTNEISPRRIALLECLGFDPHTIDAELLDDLLPEDVTPNGILMNPPFSSTAGRVAGHDPIYGAKHIEQALRRLKDQGRLVVIASSALSLTASRFRDWWERTANRYNVVANVTTEGREFAKFGTSVDVQLIVIDKDGQTPGSSWSERLEHIEFAKVGTLEEAWEVLKHLANRIPREAAQQEENQPPADVFTPYVVHRLKGAADHPAMLVESASMAAVVPPVITYKPHLPLEAVTESRLSLAQLERIIYAGQRHEQRLLDGGRAGFFVGDGTGVGKGRILAGIIADNWNQGRRRAVWFSVNNDLLPAAKLDLADVMGGDRIPVAKINDYLADGEIELPEGVVFCSYSSLISESKKGARRFDQILRWLGTQGVVVFDECHKAKNALASGRGEPTLTGQAVVDLQRSDLRPDYRFIYASATGATDVRNMAYMVRLGLWGTGTSFPNGFADFLCEIEDGGVGALEMVSRDLKAMGMYLSASISFGVDPVSGKGVEYREVIHPLTEQQREMYDMAAQAWQYLMKNIEEALKVTSADNRQKAKAMIKFWGDHQRFFNQVITAIKVPTAIKEIEAALADGKSVVCSLVNTGEARTVDKVARSLSEGQSLEDLDFTPREIIAGMIERGFPTVQFQEQTDPLTGRKMSVAVKDPKTGKALESREALRMKQRLLEGLSVLHLPENPLDQIVNHFGENAVAELTGRHRRLIRDPKTRKVVYKKRAPEGVAMTKVNVHEMEQFQSGKKRIAIISDAASMGISLHASNRCANQQRRVHITLQLGWSADKQMQVFGRTHRSDQAVPPEYVLLSTELGGERRFSSTIARRLGSLGALTKGDRGATNSGDLAKYNFETEEGRASLSFMFRAIMRGEPVAGLDDPTQTLIDMGLLTKNADGIVSLRKEDETNVPRFLNRVLALEANRQNAVFSYFSSTFDRAVETARQNGTFDEGVTDIRAEAIRFAQPPRVVATDAVTQAQTTLYAIHLDRKVERCSWEQAEELRLERNGYYVRNKKSDGIFLATPTRQHTDVETGQVYQQFVLCRPQGFRYEYRREDEMNRFFIRVTPEEVRQEWIKTFDDLPKVETFEMYLLAGSILPLWRRLKTEQDARLRVVRLTTDGGHRVVGAHISKGKLGAVLRAIGVSRNIKSPDVIFDAVLNEDERIHLVNGLYLHRSVVEKDPRIELSGSHRHGDLALYRSLGLIQEYVKFKMRYFVPTEKQTGINVLAALLRQFPQLRSAAEVEQELKHDAGDLSTVPVESIVHIDVRDLIEPVGQPKKRKVTVPTITASEIPGKPMPQQQTMFDLI